MIINLKYSALFASVLLILPYAAYADSGSTYVNQRMQIQMATDTCYNTYITGYLNAVVTVINNSTITATISATDLPKLATDYSVLQSDISANNTAQFKTDDKTFHSDGRTANHDATAAIRMAHDKTVKSTLRTDVVPIKSAYIKCLFGVRQQQASLKVDIFSKAIGRAEAHEQNMQKGGLDTSTLNKTIGDANSKIVEFKTAVENAENSTQLKSVMDSFCLYNGCKDSNNFHFAAKVAIDTTQTKLNRLAGMNTTSSYQALVSQAQTDINNAQTTLDQVNSNKYNGTQSNDVWNNIKAASDIIHQLQQIISHKNGKH
jgi:hypothetical protein